MFLSKIHPSGQFKLFIFRKAELINADRLVTVISSNFADAESALDWDPDEVEVRPLDSAYIIPPEYANHKPGTLLKAFEISYGFGQPVTILDFVMRYAAESFNENFPDATIRRVITKPTPHILGRDFYGDESGTTFRPPGPESQQEEA